MIKACIFDLDGTLLNTLDTITYYVNKALQKHNMRSLDSCEVVKCIGHGARYLIEKCMRLVGGYTTPEFFEEVFADYKRAYDADTSYLTEAYPGVTELIGRLRLGGVKLGILSNKPEGATRAVAEQFFGGAFDLVCGALEGYPLKPDPTRLNMMIAELSLDKSEVAYFGDMATDIETGIRAEVGRVFGVGWGFQSGEELKRLGALAVFDNPMEITEVIL